MTRVIRNPWKMTKLPWCPLAPFTIFSVFGWCFPDKDSNQNLGNPLHSKTFTESVSMPNKQTINEKGAATDKDRFWRKVAEINDNWGGGGLKPCTGDLLGMGFDNGELEIPILGWWEGAANLLKDLQC